MTTLASASTPTIHDTDIAIIGAGIAGLAAAIHLRAAGHRVDLLEAGPRTGGRAHTTTIHGHKFDHGASWLHAAHRNPLVTLAQARQEPIRRDTPWEDRVRIMDPPGHPADTAAYEAAEQAWQHAVTARLLNPADCSLAEAAAPVAANPWTATIEAWEGAIIAAADATDLSLADWHANQLDGTNMVAPAGLGTLLTCMLATPVRLNTSVTALAATRTGIRLDTTAGPIHAAAAIVTVSTGVLRAGHIAFAPALPPETLVALDGLPMGLLTKIVLQAATPGRLNLPAGTGLFTRLASRGAPFLSTILWPNDSDLAVSYIGGSAAWSLAGNPDEAGAFMRADLARTLNQPVAETFTQPTIMTDWGSNPLFLGAYAYARPGHAAARAALARPLWDGRLHIAGEATAPDGLAGTVAGAYRSGVAAAEAVKQAVLF